MRSSYNHVTILGRLTRNPELKQISNTVTKTYFTLAVDRHYKRADGSIETDFIPVSFWGKFADISYQLLKKGSLVLLWGKIQITNYEKDGEKRKMTEIIADNFQVLSYPKDIGESIDNNSITKVTDIESFIAENIDTDDKLEERPNQKLKKNQKSKVT